MEKAIIVGLDLGNDDFFDNSIEELKNLANACGVEVLDTIIQKRNEPTANYYIGEGKVDELKNAITTLDANLVIFDDELSPSHIRNLEKKLEIKVIDRTVLILDIFAKRAKTKEAMLQVELAQSQYMLPRVVGMYKSLSRQKSGTGSKGPGEQQLVELDRRLLRNKISHLKKELKNLVKVRRTQRQKRNKNIIKTVALAGYTNSGKSTLMNAIINYSQKQNKDLVYTKDMLFATLETKTEKIDIANGYNFLLTDTVGFIEKLPHDLIEAFKSTLEEIKEASLILHVIDISNPNYKRQIETVELILDDLGAKEIPVIYVYNKTDLVEELPLVTQNNVVFVSAKNETNVNILVEEINNIIYHNHQVNMLIPFTESNIYSELKKNTKILKTNYLDTGIEIEVKLNDYYYEKYKAYIK